MQGGQAGGPTTQPHGTGPGEPTSSGQPAPYAAPYGTSYGNPPSYGSYGYGAQAPTVQRTNGKAVASLVLSIISFLLLPLIPAIVGVILGHSARNEIKNDPAQTGGGIAVAGLVIGWINIGIVALALLSVLFVFLFVTAVIGGI